MGGSGPPIILVTAFPTPAVERQAREAGVRYFLRKPFNPTELIDAIAEILG
jgi:CheY-like chemotaxis protein